MRIPKVKGTKESFVLILQVIDSWIMINFSIMIKEILDSSFVTDKAFLIDSQSNRSLDYKMGGTVYRKIMSKDNKCLGRWPW